MSTETAPQARLDGPLDPDFINYDADIAAPDNEWSFPDPGVDPADVAEDAKNGSASAPQPLSVADDSLNEIDWEDHPQSGDNASIAAPMKPNPTDQTTAIAPSFDISMEEPELALSAEHVDTTAQEQGEIEGVEENLDNVHGDDINLDHQQGQDEGLMEHEITYEEDGELELSKEEPDISLNYEALPAESDGHAAAQAEDADIDLSRDEDDTPEQGADGVERIDVQGENEYEIQDEEQNDEQNEEQADEEVEEQSDEQHDEQNDEQYDEGSHAESAAHDNLSADQSQDDMGVSSATSLDITVTYKNEEYPLIHGQDNIDTQMGFFDDVSALDLTIDNLLARFREELTDDLAPEDEVVLQVDELGLEYSESTHRDHLSGVTLRQLHEIFDQLAKNQDPDLHRTLYTNLVIRPHPARRLEMLIDEAFNGKGLDEVIYCFQPHASLQNAHEDEDEEMYESSENEGAQSVEAEDDDGSPDEGAPAYVDDGQSEHDEEQQAEYSHDPAEGEPEAADTGDANDVEEYNDYVDLDTFTPQPPEAPEVIQITEDGNEELDIVELKEAGLMESEIQNGTEQHSPPAPDHICYCDRCLFGSQVARDTVNGLDQSKCNTPSGSTANLNTVPDDTYDDSYNAGENPDIDEYAHENGALDLIDITDDDPAAEGEQAESSVTATLAGEGENEVDFDENDLIDIANGETAVPDSTANPSNEIDWRDFADETESGLKDTLSPSGKRPRPVGDDGEELLLEGQNDVKRRRP
ncbi:uncharacterized protein DNG_03783 [Cephalotrichum gorgonifer]|uniref:Uncharacterized protein n=1 Tax=Cephalotrichum gorgonifer TaxID=2041049 RepID=A0AAE8STY5_9PEZI|nr:uncharacterized protein DNG_03783 [Cephalotrichum gorgonifer]